MSAEPRAQRPVRDLLAGLPTLAGLDDAALDRLAAAAEPVHLDAGETLVAEGTTSDAVFVVVDGQLEVSKRAGNQSVALSVCAPGELIGELSALLELPRSATVVARGPSRVVRIGIEHFLGLLDEPGVARHLLRTVARRLHNTQAQLREHEKMAALGTMAAGLTHELNNPAAALRRGATQLRDLLPRWQRLTAALGARGAAVAAIAGDLAERAVNPPALDSVARGDAEEALEALLGEYGAEPAWELAGHVVALGYTPDDLQRLAAEAGSDAVQWLAVGCVLHRLVGEAGEAAGRISGIVAAVKGYSHLDEAPEQDVDVHAGLEATLAMLRRKLSPAITVVRDFTADLPTVPGRPVELNQVWTNLLDNALDALADAGGGTLTLRTGVESGVVRVEVIDDGPGIPEALRDRVFEPFVTTKPVGSGTGLGLHITYDIVTRVHGGTISVDSGPSGTTFAVGLPVSA